MGSNGLERQGNGLRGDTRYFIRFIWYKSGPVRGSASKHGGGLMGGPHEALPTSRNEPTEKSMPVNSLNKENTRAN